MHEFYNRRKGAQGRLLRVQNQVVRYRIESVDFWWLDVVKRRTFEG
jgi:hypothetical protein